MHTITNNLSRISFHDSSIEKASRSFNELTLHFDWAKIQNYEKDSNLIDIVVGECYSGFENGVAAARRTT